MFEKIIESKVNSEADKINNLMIFSMNSIRNSQLSGFTKNFISAETDSVSDKKNLIDLIDKSVKLNLNYALRPKWTIINFLFGKLDSKPANDILNKLEIFGFYLYYPEHIANNVNESGLVVVTRDKIRNLIEEVDSALYEKFTNNITGIKIRNFFLQLFKLKYEDETRVGLDSTIPYSFLRIFLEDKKFNDVLAKFKKIEGIKDDRELDLMTITKVLTDKYSDAEEPVNREKLKAPAPPVNEDKIEVSFQEEEIIPKEQAVVTETMQTPLFSDEFTDEQSSYTPRQIKSLFKESELKIILKKIFKSDKAAMDSAFKELENIDSWYYASEYLKNLILTNKIDIHDSKIVLFVDILNEYYNKKDKS